MSAKLRGDGGSTTMEGFLPACRVELSVVPATPKPNEMRLQSIRIFVTCTPVIALMAGSLVAVGADSDTDTDTNRLSFGQDVRPIISNHCFACHGPDAQTREADVRLDVPNEVDLEEMKSRIGSTDPDIMMPPPDSNKPLSPDQIKTLIEWIDQGAPYQQHWSFLPPQPSEPPTVGPGKNLSQPIDRYVLARLQAKGMQFSPRADRRTLIRRLAFDLTGLPPTPAQIDTFLSDPSDHAYQNLVDRLLMSPAFGEQMARYWLDLVRFADTNGLHHDHYREMTPYRDWVIRSFNDNLPMDEFITYQVAGDLFDQPTVDQKIASGFNRLHLIIDRGTALPEESFFRNVVDQVAAVGTAFMGLSMQCAVCHDHKYDPITQKDFYQMYAFFNNFDGDPETGGRGTLDFKRGLQPPFLNLPTTEQEQELQRIDSEIAKLKNQIEELNAQQPTETQPAETLADQRQDLDSRLADQRKTREAVLQSIPATLVMKERSEVRPAHIMIRGAYDQPGEQVTRDVPSFLPPMQAGEGVRTRMDLAHWLTDASNPLTARVAVNRFWQQLFGVGLVKTSEDFGLQGESPSHPELLDHMAIEFVESGWNVKAMIRSIVMSQTYQQSSHASREQYRADPANRLLARGSRFRLDAEVIRDQLLSVSGLLNTERYGKSVKPPQPAGLWKLVAMPSSYPNAFEADTGDKIYRRSVYTFWKRGLPPPQMTIFDAPTRESCIARRERTNTPLQALLLMNEEQHFAGALHYAKQLLDQTDLTDDQRITKAYETITSQLPDEPTISRLRSARQQFRQLYDNQPAAAEAMIIANPVAGVESITDPGHQLQLASWTMLVHSLLNLDVTKTRE